MKFTNATPFQAGWLAGFERDGRELLVAIVKATYDLPANGEPALLAAEQLPLVQEDQFVEEPGVSAPLRESDYAHRKPACDVLLIGNAHAPAGSAVRRLQVGLSVGSLHKQFAVVGDREWSRSPLGVSAGEPRPFEVMSVGHERAFGGTDRTVEATQGKVDTYLTNPAGRGFWRHAAEIDGKPLPNTEQLDRPVTRADGDYVPMALSPIGRHWEPRARYAGTYDENWLDNHAPFWPEDFDYRYFQAAPPDQVIEYPAGGEEVTLLNLTADGRRMFRLPQQRLPVTFIPYVGRDVTRDAALDTIVIEPDENRLTLTWRCGLALGKSVFDVKETIVGEMSGELARARRFPDKPYYRNLAEAVEAHRKRKRQ